VTLQTDISRIGQDKTVTAVSALRDADQLRTRTHQIRLVTSNRQAPFYLSLLLIVVCAAAIFFVTAFTVHGIPRTLRVPVIAVLTVLLAGTVAVIVDLDHPYNGVSNVGPSYMRQVAGNSTANYALRWSGARVDRCDADGQPTT
jgi:hypothetical protein